MSSTPSQKLNAVGLYATIGAVTQGVIDAGFNVKKVLTDGSLGASSHASNFDSIHLSQGIKTWPIADLAEDEADLVYSQPLPHQCFVAGTLINTTRGNIPIEQVHPGDLVMTYGSDRFQTVTTIGQRTYKGHLISVVSKPGNCAICTPEHPFCTEYDGSPVKWTHAALLNGVRVWQPITMSYSGPVSITIIPSVKTTVYNISVDHDRCYVVAGMLVHNCDTAVSTALTLRPRSLVMETNVDLFASAKFDSWQESWESAGYNVCRLLTNAKAFGLPQLRRRAFFIAANANLDFTTEVDDLPSAPTVFEAIGDLMMQPLVDDAREPQSYVADAQTPYQEWCRRQSDGVTWQVHSPGAPSISSLIPYIPSGMHVGKIPDEIYEQTYWKDRQKTLAHGGRGKPSYFYRRLHWERPSPSVPGDIRFVHPEFDRFLTPREAARIMGIRDSFVFSGESSIRANTEIGRSGSPYVFQVVASQLAACLASPDRRTHRQRVDISAVKIPRLAKVAA